MRAVTEGYPVLVERALRLIMRHGGSLPERDIAEHIFGAASGPWSALLQRVLSTDPRFGRAPNGRWMVHDPGTHMEARPRGGDNRPRFRQLLERTPRIDLPQSADELPGALPVGLVVLAAGPKPWRHEIVALGAARHGANGVERFQTLVRPTSPCRIPLYLAPYGVSALELEVAQDLPSALDELLTFIGLAPLAGLDVALAVARLQFALRKVGRPPLGNAIVELARAEGSKPDLLRQARTRGLIVPTRLDPAALAVLSLELAEPKVDGDGSRTTHANHREPRATSASALDATAWRHLLDARMLAVLPDAPGVYLFRDAAGRLLYAGKATSLRSRLASYLGGSFSLSRRMPGLIEATARVEHEELPCELAARLREAELIAAENPPYNVQRAFGPILTRARLDLDIAPTSDSARVPRIVLCVSHMPDLDEDGFVLTTLEAARAALAVARAAWWPPRLRAAERPTADEVASRFAVLASTARELMASTPVAPGLRAADLESLVVVAPRVPERTESPPLEADVDGGWTRERADRDWPPRALLEELSQRERDWLYEMQVEDWQNDAPRPSLHAALLIDPDGLRAAQPIDGADRVSALTALAVAKRFDVRRGDAGLAALSVLLGALRRGERSVRAWPVAVGDLSVVNGSAQPVPTARR